MTHYPAPRYAASAWVAGDRLWLGFPPLDKGERGHSVHYSIDLPTLRAYAAEDKNLRGILLAIETLAARAQDATLATRGSPTQHSVTRAEENKAMYDEWLGAIKRASKKEPKAAKEPVVDVLAEAIIEELFK